MKINGTAHRTRFSLKVYGGKAGTCDCWTLENMLPLPSYFIRHSES
jgi:hypothetical protein